MEIDGLISIFGPVIQSQIAQAGFFFTMAAIIHSSRVKKEIRANFEPLTEAIKRLADNLAADLKAQSERIGGVEKKIDHLDSRLNNLEIK